MDFRNILVMASEQQGLNSVPVSAHFELGRDSRGLRLPVAKNTEILRAKTVVQGKAVVVVKSGISSFVCSENRSLPRLKCGSETMTSFG